MRGTVVLLTVLAVVSGVWASIAAFRMGAWLTRHGVKINWLWYRATMPWYVHRYKVMTTEMDGRPGPLFAQFLVAINAALVLGILAVVLTAFRNG